MGKTRNKDIISRDISFKRRILLLKVEYTYNSETTFHTMKGEVGMLELKQKYGDLAPTERVLLGAGPSGVDPRY